jgi:hypothetical protein
LRLLLAIPVAGLVFIGGFLVACGTAEEEERPAQQPVTVAENGTTATGVVSTLDSGHLITKYDVETVSASFTYTVTEAATTGP